MISNISPIPSNKPSSTHLFLKCLSKKYADLFLKDGTMRFAKPSEWAPDGTSRGDRLEGVYASLKPFNKEDDRFLRSLRTNVMRFKDKGVVFYTSQDVLSCRAYCLYGLNDNNLHLNTHRSQDHQYHTGGFVSKEYFHRLFPQWDKETYQALDDADKPVVLIIDPSAFYKRVMETLLALGIRKNEIMFKPITYFDYYNKPFFTKKYLEELFSKHISYKEQSEIRIVINTRRDEIRALFDHNNGLINIGAVDQTVAKVSDLYFEDMLVEIRGNELLYSLATPKVEDLSPELIIKTIYQTLADELPHSPLSIEELNEELSKYSNYLIQQFGATFDKNTYRIEYKGVKYDCAKQSALCMLNHYFTYMKEKEMEKAKETIEKIHHFFPMYNLDGFFAAYYEEQETNNGDNTKTSNKH
jgi:AraC-like DNA-binding protein